MTDGNDPPEGQALPLLPARPTLLETCWLVVGPTQQPIRCAIYAVEGMNIEVRAGYSQENFHRAARATDLTAAREIAEDWRRQMLRTGGLFTELPIKAP
jgi:hypothetical protein